MILKIQKRLSGDVLKSSPKRVVFDTSRLDEIKEAITKQDIRGLIKDGAISCTPKRGISGFRSRKIKVQKRRERRSGQGSRKGKKGSRLAQKEKWIFKIRAQRELVRRLKLHDLITNDTFRMLYAKTKGGFFRSVRHIKLYLEEHNLFLKK
jgi:large subunit ribosomal protein L19e